MELKSYNLNNNIQSSVQVVRNNVSDAIKMTAPTQIEPQNREAQIPSAASDQTNIKAAEALKAQNLAQAPVSYTFVRDIKLPFSKNAKLFKLALNNGFTSPLENL